MLHTQRWCLNSRWNLPTFRTVWWRKAGFIWRKGVP